MAWLATGRVRVRCAAPLKPPTEVSSGGRTIAMNRQYERGSPCLAAWPCPHMLNVRRQHRHLLRALGTCVVAVALLGTGLTSSSAGDLQGQIDTARSGAEALR